MRSGKPVKTEFTGFVGGLRFRGIEFTGIDKVYSKGAGVWILRDQKLTGQGSAFTIVRFRRLDEAASQRNILKCFKHTYKDVEDD